MNTEMRDAALALVERGAYILPLCWPGNDGRCPCGRGRNGQHEGRDVGKAPIHWLTPRGLLDATRDPDVVREWWTKAPLANIGIRTGPESGIFVLDIDSDKGGFDTLARLEREHELLPK